MYTKKQTNNSIASEANLNDLNGQHHKFVIAIAIAFVIVIEIVIEN